MDLLLHPPDDASRHPPDPAGRLSTIGHGEGFRAFAAAAGRAGIRFMVIGGTFRDVALRAASTRDIDIVLVDADALPEAVMSESGFHADPHQPHVWRRRVGDREIELQVAARAATGGTGPFSVAYAHAQRMRIEGFDVAVPRVDDYVVLKLLAAESEARRRNRDLADIQYALEARPGAETLSIAALRARLRDLYGISGRRLTRLVSLLRQVPRP